MADLQRLEELRRRVQKDPASLAFAQLAEECRRAGQYQEAVLVCRAGLAHHPDYLSARVTLGRSLLAMGHLDQARAELSGVLRDAPENLAALRGLADLHHRQGRAADARDYYRAALALAPQDPDLLAAVASLSEPSPQPAHGFATGQETAAFSREPAVRKPADTQVPSSFPGTVTSQVVQPSSPGHATASRLPALAHLERWLSVLDARRRQSEHP